MECRWIENIEEFRTISRQWDEALLLSKEDNPFLLSVFLLTWWKYYSPGLKLRIFVLYHNGNIVGGLPLCQYRSGHLEHIGGIYANYTEFLSSESNLPIWENFLESLRLIKGWRRIHIKRLRKSRIDADKTRSNAARYKNILVDVYRSDYAYIINIPENFTDYTQRLKRLHPRLGYFIRRSERRFSKLGRLTLNSLQNHAEVSELCNKYITLSRDSFRGRKRQSAFEDETKCQFFKELINNFFDAGYLDAQALCLNDRFIAIYLGYSLVNNLNYIFPAFDFDFEDLHPGHLLIYKLIEIGSKRRNAIFDFYTGYRPYKEEWCDYKEEVFSLDIRPNNIRGKIERVTANQARTSTIINKFGESIRSSGVLMPLTKKIRTFIADDI